MISFSFFLQGLLCNEGLVQDLFPLYSADQGCCRGFVTKLVYFCFYNEADCSAGTCHFIPGAGSPII